MSHFKKNDLGWLLQKKIKQGRNHTNNLCRLGYPVDIFQFDADGKVYLRLSDNELELIKNGESR